MNTRSILHRWAIRYLPSPVHHRLGGWYYRWINRSNDDIDKPPAHLAFVYGFDPNFDHVGDTFSSYFKTLAGLQPDHCVLDVGCGIGRCALPLTRMLSDQGHYDGFDIRLDGIEWCQKHITPRYPNFQFQHLDLANATYHPGGTVKAENTPFPYPDASFDFVFSKSVFTHLQAPVVTHYLTETARVLKPGGTTLHTFFLLNDVSRAGQANGTSQFDFRYPVLDGAVVSASEPEKAIAFEESFVREQYARAGLTIADPIRYGKWSGRADGLSGQDIIIARRT